MRAHSAIVYLIEFHVFQKKMSIVNLLKCQSFSSMCVEFSYIIPFRPVLSNMFQIQHERRVKRHVIENRTEQNINHGG